MLRRAKKALAAVDQRRRPRCRRPQKNRLFFLSSFFFPSVFCSLRSVIQTSRFFRGSVWGQGEGSKKEVLSKLLFYLFSISVDKP